MGFGRERWAGGRNDPNNVCTYEYMNKEKNVTKIMNIRKKRDSLYIVWSLKNFLWPIKARPLDLRNINSWFSLSTSMHSTNYGLKIFRKEGGSEVSGKWCGTFTLS
jgi:hypothetical protein